MPRGRVLVAYSAAAKPMDRVLQEQIAYYRARAPEYDEWLLRQGRYDQGPAVNAGWRTELEEVIQALDGFALRGRVLELAGGTGIWTKQLAQAAAELTVVDASPEMLGINRDRVRDPYVRYITADLFEWHPETVYDVVFFGFWLSHVPPNGSCRSGRSSRAALRRAAEPSSSITSSPAQLPATTSRRPTS
jgi:2-polyprenyl-3-methyl-5-hydroxy-6-metoxy-1,4-benzoquinol methylase